MEWRFSLQLARVDLIFSENQWNQWNQWGGTNEEEPLLKQSNLTGTLFAIQWQRLSPQLQCGTGNVEVVDAHELLLTSSKIQSESLKS